MEKKLEQEEENNETNGQQLLGTNSSSLSSFQAFFLIPSYFSLLISPHRKSKHMMENHPKFRFNSNFFFIIIFLSFGLLSFILCISSEILKNKKQDIRWNGRLCYLPTSKSFGLGISALVCISVAQIVGNSILFKNYCSRQKRSARIKNIPAIAKILLLICWLCFGFAVILLIAATSMSRKQPYGIGWLNGECYLVKRGTYAGSAMLILATLGSITGSTLATIKTSQADQGLKTTLTIGDER